MARVENNLKFAGFVRNGKIVRTEVGESVKIIAQAFEEIPSSFESCHLAFGEGMAQMIGEIPKVPAHVNAFAITW
ncbi:hypothetical protein MAIC_46450 [Mycolicibacterium aichiense]|uniref:Uncharacterized protein n=1 Tax=Mycolicibacterium aichiense TaxID=1799 RepID=A0AAD1MCT9_9MYCO|nr:hypothetical protein MAIC_46450 [Mycolicibacterium aichiense]